MPPNAFYAQSGGVTSVINASAAGVLETARANPKRIGKVLAGRNGILGALDETLLDTSTLSDRAVRALKHTPGGAFGSCRYKLNRPAEQKREYDRLLAVFAAHNIGYFFYNGGGDSADTCLKVSALARRQGYPLQAIHIPKTVDNDLPLTDTCPGFGSVAKYVAVSTREASLDVASMSATSTKVFILEVMGRHTGWIAAAGGLAADTERKLPVILLVPERPFSTRAFIAKLRAHVERFGFVSIVVAEGLRDSKGRLMAEQGGKDAFGHAQLGGIGTQLAALVRQKTGYKYHVAVADYLQRAARHLASQTDLDQAYAVGAEAVRLALKGEGEVMASIVRVRDKPYKWKLGSAPLAKVANRERNLPATHLSRDGFSLSAAGQRYLTPLIQGEAYPPYHNGLPDYLQVTAKPVTPKLPPFHR